MAAPRKSKMFLIRLWTVCFALLLVAYLTQGVLAETPKRTKKTATPTSVTTQSEQSVQPMLPLPSPTMVLPTATATPSTTPLPPTPTEIIPPTVTNVPPTVTVTVSPEAQPSTAEGDQTASTSVEPATELDQPSATPNPPTSTSDLPLPSLTATAETSPTVTVDDPTDALPTNTQAAATEPAATTSPSSDTAVLPVIPTDTTIDSTTAASPIELQPTDAPMALPPATASPLPQLIESDSSSVQQTGEWTDQTADAASGGHYVYSSSSPSDSLTLTFQGSGLDVGYVRHPALGSFAIEIDGETLLTVEATAPSSVFGTRAEIRNLASGFHTARVYPVSGTIAIDVFAVELPTSVDIVPMDTPTIEPTAESTIEPTTLPSVTPTLTAMPTNTPVPTETITSTATSLPTVRLSGQVNSFAALSPATITIAGGGLRQTIAAQPDGAFTLSLPAGNYQLTVTALNHLPYASQITVTDQPLTLPAISLVAGDVNGDGVIDDKDIHLVTENFGLMAPPAPVAADVNGDGMVNIYDLVIVSANRRVNK